MDFSKLEYREVLLTKEGYTVKEIHDGMVKVMGNDAPHYMNKARWTGDDPWIYAVELDRE